MPVETEFKNTTASDVWPGEIPELLTIKPPEQLRVPLGARGVGEVSVRPPGTRVARGEPLVEHASESSHVPLAPADGVVGNVRPIRLTGGNAAAAVELTLSTESHGAYEGRNLRGLPIFTLVEALESIRWAGAWADRHASPDLIGQLNQIVTRPIDTIICSILDSDASLRLNSLLAARFSERVIDGLSLLSASTSARRVLLAIESFTEPRWLQPLVRACAASHFETVDLANDYPQSDPTLMVYSLVARRLKPGTLPPAQGVLLLDAAAALAIGGAAHREPMLSAPVAVHDHARRHSHFVLAPVGASIEHLLRQLSIPADDAVLRGGDLLRDQRIRPDAVISGGELAIHVTGPERPVIPEPCIRCAWCFEACPTLVQPALVLDAAQRRDLKMAQRAGIGACIECGVCSHVCPSQLPLLQAIRSVRQIKAE